MQKIAGDVEAIDKICDILLTVKIPEDDLTSSAGSDKPEQNLLQSLYLGLAALTSVAESCRKKLIERKRVLEELFIGIKCAHRGIKMAALTLFVSLSRSDKMLKSIIM